MLNKFMKMFKSKDYVYDYLSNSVDLVDLENRMREIDRGTAPFQRSYGNLYMG